ncbi:hypothetical protein N0V92_000245 [Colletotrichum tropicale]|nr:hypothetical protein N0V92_000245 [Colletotrichum tropicale]
MSNRSAMSLTGDEALTNWYSSTFKAADLRQEAERRGLKVSGKAGRQATKEENLAAIYLSEINIDHFSEAIQSDFRHFSRWLASQTLDGSKHAVTELGVETGMTKSTNHRLALRGLTTAKGILPDCVPPNNARNTSDSNSHTSTSPFGSNAPSSRSILDTREKSPNAYVREWASNQSHRKTVSPEKSTSIREDEINCLCTGLHSFHGTNVQTQNASSYKPFTNTGQPVVSVPNAESVLSKLTDVGIPNGGASIQNMRHVTGTTTSTPLGTAEVLQSRYPTNIVTPGVQQTDDMTTLKPLLLSLVKAAIAKWPEEFTTLQPLQSSSNDANIA